MNHSTNADSKGDSSIFGRKSRMLDHFTAIPYGWYFIWRGNLYTRTGFRSFHAVSARGQPLPTQPRAYLRGFEGRLPNGNFFAVSLPWRGRICEEVAKVVTPALA